MKALITGAGGTVGQALVAAISSMGGDAVAYDLSVAPAQDYGAMERYIQALRPTVLFHLAIASEARGPNSEGWIINEHWPSELAWLTAQHGIPFVFTSTAMVFTNDAPGPFTPDTPPDATEGYGGEKVRTEHTVRRQNPAARIVRLGWQIGSESIGNQMVAWMENQQRDHGVVRASRLWIPACSFLEDTAEALLRLPAMAPGLYHLDGNEDNDSFHAIALGLNRLHGEPWKVEADDSFVYNQRLIDPRLPVGAIRQRLPA
jgi:dTDP-4-dehydrorhamnose reductase